MPRSRISLTTIARLNTFFVVLSCLVRFDGVVCKSSHIISTASFKDNSGLVSISTLHGLQYSDLVISNVKFEIINKVLDRYWINVWIQDGKFITTFCIKKGLVNIGVNVTGSNGQSNLALKWLIIFSMW